MIFFWKHVVRYHIFYMSFDKKPCFIDESKVRSSFKGLIPSVITSFEQKSTFGFNSDCEIINICKLFNIISNDFRPPDGLRKLPVLWDTSMDPYDHFQST